MDLHVTLDGRRDLTAQIYLQVRAAILDGRLRPGEALPPTRDLATTLAVSRNTANAAYEKLAAEGFLTSRVGVGTFVSNLPFHNDQDHEAPNSPLRPRPMWDTMPDPPDMSATTARYDFRPGMPDATHFPFATWRALLSSQLRNSATTLGKYGEPLGHAGLRAAIARHVGVSRAVRATPADIMITAGVQQAVDLIARVMLAPGDVVAVEDPGYPPVKRLFQSLGLHVIGVPVDAEGLVVDHLPTNAKLVYTSPSHQFPLGYALSLSRRLALLAWAERTDAVIIEDDYDSEFRWTGRPVEPLHALDRTGRVVYVSSFSKVLLPTLRIGFCVAPPPLHSALRKAKHLADWHSTGPLQGALAEFIDSGSLSAHLKRMRRVYRTRRDRMAMAFDQDFTDLLEPITSTAGLHVTAWLRTDRPGEDQAIITRARHHDVALHSMILCGVDHPPRQGFVFGYGLIATDDVDEGLRRLRRAFT
ncbi:PLP-dependent aminotransferase family protein [Umezawaea sp. NPDC059074]|uniref:MocR-like pyridoxine biosynthesis transcription factor PdxR n=1 Tax=Umezawaea sp. NPDC059074 TaxID=3346716 RepID=UPI0036AED07B